MSFQRRTLAGGPDDFMQVEHLRFRGSNRSIGAHLAKLALAELGVRKPQSDTSVVARQNSFMQERWPEDFERMRGVADILGSCAQESIDCSSLMYHWGVPGCSNAFYPPSTTRATSGPL